MVADIAWALVQSRPDADAHVLRDVRVPFSIASGSLSCSAVALMYTPCPVPAGTVLSNTTMAICGRTAMFWEWRAPG